MSTTQEQSQANINAFLRAGGTQDILAREKYGGKLSTNELNKFIAKYNLKQIPLKEAVDAYENPASMPNLSDPYGLYDYYMKSKDITETQQAIKDLTEKLNAFDTASQKTVLGIESTGDETMAYIPGAVAQYAKQRGIEREGLAKELLAKQSYLDTLRAEAANRYNIALGEREKIQQLIAATKGEAGITYADTYDEALRKSAKWEKKQAEEKHKQEYKESLKQIALQYGIKTKGKSIGELEKSIAKYNKEIVKQTKEENRLKLEAAKWEIENTKSLIAERGRRGGGGEGGSSSKIFNEFFAFANGIAKRVKAGDLTREEGRDLIERFYPGEGNAIYELVPDFSI